VTRGAALLFTTVCLCHAQQSTLGRKGRQPERAPAGEAEPIRKLPRPPAVRSGAPGGPLERFIEEQRRSRPERPLLFEPRDSDPSDSAIRLLPRNADVDLRAAAPAAGVEAEPLRNRWKIFPTPPWRRYDDPRLDAIYATSRPWDPFNRNTLKADFPIAGRRLFFDFTGASETLLETRRIPVPEGASTAQPGNGGFFGHGEQFATAQNFRLSFDLFRGAAGFRPVDFELRVTPEFNINYSLTRENGLTSIDVARGPTRTDTAIGMQEAFVEKRLYANDSYFDFTSVRAGIQRFTSDFRGFVFSDEQPGARLFGTFHNNVFQYNLAYFNLLEKDANSGLNRWRHRNQSVYAANLYWNDFLTKGYNLNFSALYNNDQPSFLIDKNGFLVRPTPAGVPLPHKVRAGYAGISGDGHIGRINVSHTFYEAFGRDSFNPIPARNHAQHIQAQLAALELAYEHDWMTFRVSGFYASGDGNLNDGRATGFDAIVPNQQFAGGGFLGNPSLADRGLINNRFEGGGTNFLNREAFPLTGTGLFLFGPNSLLPSMRAGLFEGQANFINPGILLVNAGLDAKITPRLRSTLNVNWARFNRTEALEALLFQSHIRHAIGLDTGVGLQFRPLLNDNIVLTGGVGVLTPGGGFRDIYAGQLLYSGFVNVRLVF
jgi:hypothetical protein